MTSISGRRVLLACLGTFVVTIGASLSGLDVGQFLAGAFGGGVLTAAFLTVRNRTR